MSQMAPDAANVPRAHAAGAGYHLRSATQLPQSCCDWSALGGERLGHRAGTPLSAARTAANVRREHETGLHTPATSQRVTAPGRAAPDRSHGTRLFDSQAGTSRLETCTGTPWLAGY